MAPVRERRAASQLRSHGESPRPIAQAVTRAIAELERRLGTRLFHRTTRSVSLTSEGGRYLERGRGLVAEFDELEAAAGSQVLRGRLAVTAPVMFGQLHVLPVIAAFLREHDGVDLRLSLLDRVVSLADEGVDLAVRIGALPDSALRARKIGSVHALTVASPGYLRRAPRLRTLDDLAAHDCISVDAMTPIPDRWRFPRAHARERSIGVHARLVLNTTQSAVDAAIAGLGVARLLSYQVATPLARKQLVTVLDAHRGDPAPVHLVQLPGVASRAASELADFAASALGARLRATD